MISLRKITSDNWHDIRRLAVHKEQEDFVAPNLYSLAEAYVDSVDGCPPLPLAIYNGDEPVGFIMSNYEVAEENEWADEDIYHICRFMIDKNHQGKGYGREAMLQMIELLKTGPLDPAKAVTIGSEPENHVVRKIYDSLGFVEVDYELGDEIIARLEL